MRGKAGIASAVGTLLGFGALPASAGGLTIELTTGVETTSVFRGYRAQRLNPNPYAVLDLERGAFYAGLYAAPVAFGPETNALLTGYAGWLPAIAGFNLDLGVGYYAFPDSRIYQIDSDGDGLTDHSGRKGLVEPYAGFAREAAGVEIEAFAFFTPDSLGETGPGWYGSIEASTVLGQGISLVAGYGVSRFDNDRLNDDYDDWRVMLEKQVFGFDLKLRYSDTVGALGPDNRTLSLIIERPFGLMTRSIADARDEKIRNRFIIDKCRLMAGR